MKTVIKFRKAFNAIHKKKQGFDSRPGRCSWVFPFVHSMPSSHSDWQKINSMQGVEQEDPSRRNSHYKSSCALQHNTMQCDASSNAHVCYSAQPTACTGSPFSCEWREPTSVTSSLIKYNPNYLSSSIKSDWAFFQWISSSWWRLFTSWVYVKAGRYTYM